MLRPGSIGAGLTQVQLVVLVLWGNGYTQP